MWLAAWRSLVGHKLRLTLSALAITLSVSFVAGSLIFTNLLNSAFVNILKGTLADVNVAIKGTNDPSFVEEASEQSKLTKLSPTNLIAISAVPGVASVQGVVRAFNAQLVGKNGKLVGFPGAISAAGNWFTAPAAEGGPGIVLQEGSAPASNDEVVLDPPTLSLAGYAIGDQVEIVTQSGLVRKKVVGTAQWGDAGGSAGATYMFFTTKEAQRLFTGGQDVYQVAWVVAEPGITGEELAKRVAKVIPPGFEATAASVAADESSKTLQKSLGFLNIFLLVFAGIAVLVASFLIVNTFNLLVAQRARELALLRAVGAKRRQIQASVLAEAAIVGTGAATVGLLLGWGLAWGIKITFASFGVSLGATTPSLTWTAVLASYVVGIVVTVLAALAPAVRASRVPPVFAMSGADLRSETGTRFVWAGLGVASAGIAVMFVGAWTNTAAKWWLLVPGAVCAMVGTAVATPLVGVPVVILLGKLFVRTHAQVGELATRNTMREPRRLAATTAALMIGLALVTTVAVLGRSAEDSLQNSVRQGLRGDLQVSKVTLEPFTGNFGDQMEKVPGVEAVYRLHVSPVFAGKGQDRSQTTLVGQTKESFNQVIAQQLVAGAFPEELDTAMVSQYRVNRFGHAIGDVLTLQSPGGAAKKVRVVGIFANPDGIRAGGLVVSPETLRRINPIELDQLMSIRLAPGADLTKVRAELERIAKPDPGLLVTNQQEWGDLQVSQISLALRLLYALLGLALVIAVLGIVNTLVMAVIERTREIGLLRAVGMTRPQVRRLITLEAVIVTVLGSVLGLALGLAFGISLWKSAEPEGLRQLGIPWVQLLAFLGISVAMGLLAAIWPARRAARLDVLAAIATD